MEDSAERWLQLAEMTLDGEESKALWSGEMEKSCCVCEETPLGLLRMLITCKHIGEDSVSRIFLLSNNLVQSKISIPDGQINSKSALNMYDSLFDHLTFPLVSPTSSHLQFPENISDG